MRKVEQSGPVVHHHPAVGCLLCARLANLPSSGAELGSSDIIGMKIGPSRLPTTEPVIHPVAVCATQAMSRSTHQYRRSLAPRAGFDTELTSAACCEHALRAGRQCTHPEPRGGWWFDDVRGAKRRRHDASTNTKQKRPSTRLRRSFGSPGWIRTSDQLINSVFDPLFGNTGIVVITGLTFRATLGNP